MIQWPKKCRITLCCCIGAVLFPFKTTRSRRQIGVRNDKVSYNFRVEKMDDSKFYPLSSHWTCAAHCDRFSAPRRVASRRDVNKSGVKTLENKGSEIFKNPDCKGKYGEEWNLNTDSNFGVRVKRRQRKLSHERVNCSRLQHWMARPDLIQILKTQIYLWSI